MKNTGKAVAIGIVILVILFVASRFFGEMNPFDSPYKNLLDNVELVNDKLGLATVRHDNEVDRFISLMHMEIKNDTLNQNQGLSDTLSIIRSRKNQIMNQLNEGIAKMEEFGEMDEYTGELKRPTYSGDNIKYWFDERQIAERLYDDLNNYYQFMADLYNSQVIDENARIVPTKISSEPRAEWAEKNFRGPVLINIAVLRGLKMEVINETFNTLEMINTRLGVGPFKANEVIAVSVPASNRVLAGLQFEAELYPVLTSSSHQIIYSSPNGAIATNDEGRTTLTIPASGNVIPQGKNEGKQSYMANLQIRKANGGIQNLEVNGEFTVAKPSIEMNLVASNTMYRNCGNDFLIKVPGLGDLYNPRISASSAQVIPSKKTREKFRIVPTGRDTRVTVNSITNGHSIKIGDVDYKVINPPKPSISMAVNGKPYNGLIPVSANSQIEVRVEPDPDFSANYPNDAMYGITSIDVLAQLSLGPPTVVNQVNTAGRDATEPIAIPLGTRVRQAKKGTTIMIRLNEVYRVNFLKKRIPDKRFSDLEKVMTFRLR